MTFDPKGTYDLYGIDVDRIGEFRVGEFSSRRRRRAAA